MSAGEHIAPKASLFILALADNDPEKRAALARALRMALAHAEAMEIPRRNLIVDVDAVSLM